MAYAGPIVLQWADPLGASSNDYDLFLVNEDGDVVASSTDTQDGTQDPIESISFGGSSHTLVVVKVSGADRYLRLQAIEGRLEIATAGTLYGHSAAENAVSVSAVDVRTAAGSGKVFNGTESVTRGNSDGPRRIFFEPDGTAITAGDFSETGGKLLRKPDLTAASCVSTATPGFSTFCGASAAAPHAAAVAALMVEAAGGPKHVTQKTLLRAMTGQRSTSRPRVRPRCGSRHPDGAGRGGSGCDPVGGAQQGADGGGNASQPDAGAGRSPRDDRHGDQVHRSGQRHPDLRGSVER